MTGILTKGGHLEPETDTHRGQAMWTDIGRRWPSVGQREGPGTDPWLTALRRTDPADTLILDFVTSGILQDNTFLFFCLFVIIHFCCVSHPVCVSVVLAD